MERKYCGLNHEGIYDVLTTMCDLEDKYDLTEEEMDKFDIAIQCVNEIHNRMLDGAEIMWDEEGEKI